MRYEMRRPCASCPFRYDVPGFLTSARAEEIAESILRGESFPCHKTVNYSSEDDDEAFHGVVTSESQHCAGAMILLEHEGKPGQMMRIAERLGIYDHRCMDMDAPVFISADEFICHHDA